MQIIKVRNKQSNNFIEIQHSLSQSKQIFRDWFQAQSLEFVMGQLWPYSLPRRAEQTFFGGAKQSNGSHPKCLLEACSCSGHRLKILVRRSK